jgi:hypothetical protein
MSKIKAETWRAELKVGDKVDAIKKHFKSKCWGVAKIVEVGPNDLLELWFDNEMTQYDRNVLRYS